MHPRETSNKTTLLVSATIASTKAAVIETVAFHWLDTIAKRIQNHRGRMYQPQLSYSRNYQLISQVLLRDAANKGFFQMMTSLYQGLGWGSAYKVCQRTFKFSGQKPVQALVSENITSNAFWSNGIAGMTMGVAEALLFNPLDTLKIKLQTNPELFKSQLKKDGLRKIILSENILIKGTGVAMARNSMGSFMLFSTPVFMRRHVLKIEDQRQATTMEKLVTNGIGSIASIATPAPLDLVKTRIQAGKSPATFFETFTKVIKNEGMLGLYKGMGIKFATVALKQAVFMTLFESLLHSSEKSKKAAKTRDPVENHAPPKSLSR